MNFIKRSFFYVAMACQTFLMAQSINQTNDLSPIFPGNLLPFSIEIQLADFQLPNGFHSGAFAQYKGEWLFIAGRTNGLHGFEDDDNNFPPQTQNQVVYVVDPDCKKVYARSLADPGSGFNQAQIDFLSVTSPEYFQKGSTLYMVGGYGVDSATGIFSTKPLLTVIDIPRLIHWVKHPLSQEIAAKAFRFLFDPIFQVTGGVLSKIGNNPFLLVFGQNFSGFYVDSSDGDYTRQVRRFRLDEQGKKLKVVIEKPNPLIPDPNFRRRDLNVIPAKFCKKGKIRSGLVAFSGVFTLDTGVWTVPVTITANGKTSMADPLSPHAFKQGMNNYICPAIPLFSKRSKTMYTSFLGGISFGFFENGIFQTSDHIPFINQVTTIKMDKHCQFTQFLNQGEYPVILSSQSNFGNRLLFGAGAYFLFANDLPHYKDDVIKMDELKKSQVIGYVVGGIQSTKDNTDTQSDSAASPFIFKVIFNRNRH